MLVDAIFVSGRCGLNCPSCPYKSDPIDEIVVYNQKKRALRYFYGGDVLESIESPILLQALKNSPMTYYQQITFCQATPLTIIDQVDKLDLFDIFILPQVLDYQDSVENTGLDIVSQLESSIKILKEKNKKIILVAQVNDLNVNTIIDNYYHALDNGALLILNISDTSLSVEEKEYLKYLTRKSKVIATQIVPGACSYCPGFMLSGFNAVSFYKLFSFLMSK